MNLGLNLGKSGATSGLVGESSLAVLPIVKPIHTFLITLIGIMVRFILMIHLCN